MKFLFFVIALLAPFTVSANTALQELACVLSNMDSVELGPNGEYQATPSVSNDGVKQFVTFTTITTDDPATVAQIIRDYMATSVGGATSTYQLQKTKLQSLATVISNFENPSLGNRVCKQQTFISKSGWAYVAITVPLNGTAYDVACEEVRNYLSSQGYLDSTTTTRVSYLSDTDEGYLELWCNS
ncbi:hypothetical protein Bhyg_16174 [Pseudolycoriella hygida]|uniref:Uncharacterized protein n=1 Tax=Pseudolycoriella hygida TaxID=35572 RepID=A0A9Q0RSJ1_9DIPT|nr:hypothetical protein Bhyg_16174 [Pseudolycoriella hygida]